MFWRKNKNKKNDEQFSKAENLQNQAQLEFALNEEEASILEYQSQLNANIKKYNDTTDQLQKKRLASVGQGLLGKLKEATSMWEMTFKAYENAQKIAGFIVARDKTNHLKSFSALNVKMVEQFTQQVSLMTKEFAGVIDQVGEILDAAAGERHYVAGSNTAEYEALATDIAAKGDAKEFGDMGQDSSLSEFELLAKRAKEEEKR
ncbi:MAG: hypothetical protein FWB72_00015 [Firmicutes bacterium]|nr:hypothetical protein [Bacillota bacterium]